MIKIPYRMQTSAPKNFGYSRLSSNVSRTENSLKGYKFSRNNGNSELEDSELSCHSLEENLDVLGDCQKEFLQMMRPIDLNDSFFENKPSRQQMSKFIRRKVSL